MNWDNPKALYLLLLVPILIIFLFNSKKRRKQQLLRFTDENLLGFHNLNFSSFYFNLKNFLLIMALLFTIIAIARPQWDKEIRIIDTQGQDIVFLIDVSKSMDAQDITPSRLEKAKMHISLFLDELKGDRVALVAFAGNAQIICPLTTDYSAIKLLINGLSSETITNYGTDIGAGLAKAAEVFDKEASAKTLILLSDGEDLEEQGIQQARELAQQAVTIYTLGIGNPEGSPIMVKNNAGYNEYAKDNKGNVIFTKVDIQGLHSIAEITEGQFYMVSPNYSEIFDILKQISDNEKSKYSTKQYFRYKEQYHLFLILCLIIIIIESLVNYRAKETA